MLVFQGVSSSNFYLNPETHGNPPTPNKRLRPRLVTSRSPLLAVLGSRLVSQDRAQGELLC